jgi:serine/threonine-protein kinase HipA
MNPVDLKYCPSTLAEGFNTYSPSALRNMFFGKKVSHILDFDPPDVSEEVAETFRQNSKTISISGAQFKQSLVLEKNKLRLTQPGESGRYILKPVPIRPPFGKAEELPANEHLTMQIAKQVYGINTAECGLIFFKNGEPAYITKRFDYNGDGVKIAQEDFASLSGLAKGKDGEEYKNQGSYEDIARVMKRHIGAYAVEAEKYYDRVVFNYLFNNGDAHLKNFSLSQTPSGDYVLSQAYDMIDTRIHIASDSFFALRDGLFSEGYATESFNANGFYAYDDFYEFGRKIGLMESRIVKALNKYRNENADTRDLINRSFLSGEAKILFESHYADRLRMLNHSYAKKI